MPLPKEFNMHRINDYLLSKDSGLTHAQKVVAYHCLHLDFGRKKNGKFWKGATAIARDLGWLLSGRCELETDAKPASDLSPRSTEAILD